MSQPIPIDDPADERIAAFRAIRERDVTGRDGFIAEGTVVLDQLLSSTRFRPTALLILRARLDGLRDRLAKVPPGTPVYVAERPVIDAIAGFPMHRGVLAHGERLGVGEEEAEALLSGIAAARGMVVVAVGIANHDNMGAIFRNAAAFGVGAVIVGPSCCDPLYRKAIRVSVGSVLSVPFLRHSDAHETARRLAGLGFACLALSPAGAEELHAVARDGPVALFLGAEGEGLPQNLMAAMRTVRIAMAPGFDSINVATAAAIALHRLYSAG